MSWEVEGKRANAEPVSTPSINAKPRNEGRRERRSQLGRLKGGKGAIGELKKNLRKEVNSVNQKLNVGIEKVKGHYRQPDILA